MEEKLYHFYFDEGGTFGHAVYSMEVRKTNSNKRLEENSVFQYYQGKLPLHTIKRYLQLFHKAFPKCIILQCGSQPYDIRNLLKEHEKELLKKHIRGFLDFQLRETLHEINQPNELKIGLGSIYNPEKIINKYLDTLKD